MYAHCCKFKNDAKMPFLLRGLFYLFPSSRVNVEVTDLGNFKNFLNLDFTSIKPNFSAKY